MTFIGVPALVLDALMDSNGNVLMDRSGQNLIGVIEPASLAEHRQFMIYAGIGIALITGGLVMQAWEAGERAGSSPGVTRSL